MKKLNSIFYPIIKFSKGILALVAINILIVISVFIFNSCKKTEFENSDNGKANLKFRESLTSNKQFIASISFENEKINLSSEQLRISSPYIERKKVYIAFPDEVTPEIESAFNNTKSIQDLANLIEYTDAIIQDEPNGNSINYPIVVPIEKVAESLNPLVIESKEYLYSKGFSENAIQQMLTENNGTELDLIPFVIALTEIEKNQSTFATNNLNLFIGSTYAMNEYVKCAMVAIGADVLWALGGSQASAWSMTMMTKAFGAVAKRFLGPIGVAIAVVSFGLCIGT